MRFPLVAIVAALALAAVSVAAQETPTEREAAREVLKKMGDLEASLDVPGLVAKLTGPNPARDAVTARAKELMEQDLLALGDDITRNPEIGFVRRDNMRRNYGLFKFTPRISSPSIRKLSYGASLAYVTGGDGLLETREQNGEFGIDFLNNDKLYVSVSNLFDLLRRPFAIGPGVTLPSGGYAYRNVKVNYNMSQGHAVGANITFDRGSFYNGDKTSLSIARGRVRVSSRMSAEPTYSVNRVSLDQGRFTTVRLRGKAAAKRA